MSSIITKSNCNIDNPNISDDFEEVSIDGRSSSSTSSLAVTKSSSKVFTCKPCKIYFPLEHMFDKHMRTIHEESGKSRRKEKKKSRGIIERLKEEADGYHKKKDELYLCNYCPYESNIQSMVCSHVARKHGNFRTPVSVTTPTVTVAIEPASVEIKEEEPEIEMSELELKFEEPEKESIEFFEEPEKESIEYFDEEIMDDSTEIVTQRMQLIGENMEMIEADIEMIGEGIEIVQDGTEFFTVSPEAFPTEGETDQIQMEEVQDEFQDTGEKQVIHQSKVYNCPYCDFQSNRRSFMHSHISNQHTEEWQESMRHRDIEAATLRENTYFPIERKHTCYFCHFSATTRSTLNAHTRRKHPGYLQPARSRRQPPTELQCNQCDFKTMDRHKIQMHIERKHVTECRFTCEYCGKKFKVKCDLTSHIRFQHFRTPTVCDVCGKICSNSNALRVHQKREHYKPDFECNICKRRMVSKENLEDHIQRQHEQRIKYMCEQCGKVFDQQNKLKQHTMTHTGEKPHTCHLCGKSFARRAVFRQHLLIHTGQRPYVCDICGKSFTQKPGLICHRKMHPGDKPPLPVVYIDHILDKFVQKHQ